jgi:hypothetical protein
MATSEWLAVGLTGLGAILGTFPKHIIRVSGFTVMFVAIAGSIFWRSYNADAQEAAITADHKSTIVSVPGNGNSVTVTSQVPGDSPDNPVAKREDCPPGTQVFVAGKMNGNGQYGASIPQGMNVCFTSSAEMNGNGKGGLQVR